MADFPALVPAIRPLTPGQWGGATLPSMSGRVSTVRRSSAEIGRRLSLSFEAITEAQFLQIVAHYQGQRSGLDGFAFTTTTLPTSYTPSGHQWLYAGPPRVVDRHADVFAVELECRSEPRGVFRVLGKAFTVQPALAAGVITTPISGAALAPTLSFTAASPLVAIPGGTFTCTPTLAAGSTEGSDPNFSSVVLLCGFNGANGSTAFVDEGPLGLTLTAKGGAQISTAQSVFGGSSLSVAGSGSVGLPTNSALVLSGDFTLDARCRFNASKKDMILGSRTGVNNQIARESGTTLGVFNGSSATASFTTATNTWYALRWARSGSTLYFFGDGTLLGSSTVTGTFDFSGGDIGQLFGNNVLDGFIDELRLSTICRSTASYTVDASPFPRS
jgi:hypothetical protein